MPNQRNIDRLQELETKINSAKILIIADHSGLSVAAQTKLRQEIAKTNGEFTVTKNTLLSRILTNKLGGLPRDVEDVLRGPTAILIGQEDAVISTKSLTKFIDKYQLPTIKLGLLDDKILSIDEVSALSKLGSREQLLAALLSQLNAPAQNLVGVLSAKTRHLVYTLNAIKNQQPAMLNIKYLSKGGETN